MTMMTTTTLIEALSAYIEYSNKLKQIQQPVSPGYKKGLKVT